MYGTEPGNEAKLYTKNKTVCVMCVTCECVCTCHVDKINIILLYSSVYTLIILCMCVCVSSCVYNMCIRAYSTCTSIMYKVPSLLSH